MKKTMTILLTSIILILTACNISITPLDMTEPIITYDPETKMVDIQFKYKGVMVREGDNACIKYTLDKSEPSTKSKIFEAPFKITENTTIKAMVVNYYPEYLESPVVSLTIKVNENKPDTPEIKLSMDTNHGKIMTVTATTDSKVYYTLDKTDPRNEDSTRKLYTEPIRITESATISATNYKNGVFSIPLTQKVIIYPVNEPQVTVSGNENFLRNISILAEEGSATYYTLDGTDPRNSASRNVYTEPFTITESCTIRSYSTKNGLESPVVNTAASVINAPEIEITRIDSNTKKVSMSIAEGSEIYYTLDGSNPTKNGTLYTTEFTVEENCILKAVAKWESHYSAIIEKEIPLTVSKPSYTIDDVVNGKRNVYFYFEEGALLYISYDGEDPTTTNNRFILDNTNEYVIIQKNTTLRVVAVKDDCKSDEIKLFVTIPKTYKVRDVGPAGGIIFYDCDADNESGNADGLISSECGWRYMEAAPAPLHVVNGRITVDKSMHGYNEGQSKFEFTQYKPSKNESYSYVNGTTGYDSRYCTNTSVGSGLLNTELLVNAMKYSNSYNSKANKYNSNYAALLCTKLKYEKNGIVYDDWFLPSIKELMIMNNYVQLDQFTWSSSEYKNSPTSAYVQSHDRNNYYSRDNAYSVYPVRVFSDEAVSAPAITIIEEEAPTKNKLVSLECITPGAEIYYTTDGSNPRIKGTLYSDSFFVDKATTVRAYAKAEGLFDSPDGFNLCGGNMTVRKPSISMEIDINDKIIITITPNSNYSCTYYTINGEEPTVNSTVYTGPFEVQSGDIVQAITYYEGMKISNIASFKAERYAVGDLGPAGGIIFYDCDADNESGNPDGLISSECGWRFIETAPAQLKLVDDIPTIEKNFPGYNQGSDSFQFGYKYVSEQYYSAHTDMSIGSGISNTTKLVSSLNYDGSNYDNSKLAAILCDQLEYEKNGVIYDDWFLPSIMEIQYMSQYISMPIRVWSSSEDLTFSYKAYSKNGVIISLENRDNKYPVYPARAFQD